MNKPKTVIKHLDFFIVRNDSQPNEKSGAQPAG